MRLAPGARVSSTALMRARALSTGARSEARARTVGLVGAARSGIMSLAGSNACDAIGTCGGPGHGRRPPRPLGARRSRRELAAAWDRFGTPLRSGLGDQ